MIKFLFYMLLTTFAAFATNGQSWQPRLLVSDGVDDKGHAINPSGDFAIPDTGRALYLLATGTTEVESDKVTWIISRLGNDKKTSYQRINQKIKSGWKWFWQKVIFTHPGTYVIELLGENNDTLGNCELIIRSENPLHSPSSLPDDLINEKSEVESETRMVVEPADSNKNQVVPKLAAPEDSNKLNTPCYIICWAATTMESEAKSMVKKLKQKGLEADYLWIPDYNPDGKKMYRVHIGHFKTKADALKILPAIRAMNPQAYAFFMK